MSTYELLLCVLGVGALMVHGKPLQNFLEEYSEALLNAAVAQQACYPSYYELDDASKRLGRSNELNSIQDVPKPMANTAGGLGGLANYFAYNPLRGAAPAPGLIDPSKVGTGTGSKAAAPGEKTVGGKGTNDTAAATDVAKYYEQIKAQQEILAQQQLQQTLYQEQQRKQQEYLALQQQLQQQYYQQQQALLMLEQLNKNPAFVDQLAGFSNLKGSTAGATVGVTGSVNAGSTTAPSTSSVVIDTKPEKLDADKTKALNAKDQTVANHLEAEKQASGKLTKHLEPRQAEEEISTAAPSESANDSAEDEDQDVSTIEKVYSVSSED